MHFRLLAITALASHSTAASQGYPHQDAPASTCMCSPSTDPTAALTIPAPTSVPSDKQKTLDEDNKALAREVSAEVTNFQRFNKLLTVDGEGTDLLPVDQLQQRVVFTFRTAPDQGEGGRFKLANLGISTAVGFLKPCSMNSPHTHPRATEWLTTVQGNLSVGYILENGFVDPNDTGAAFANEVRYSVGPFEGTVFP